MLSALHGAHGQGVVGLCRAASLLLGATVPSHLLVSDNIHTQDEEQAWKHVLSLD